MKKLLKGFTLVEILIVIVIIGILIGALVPRMSAAQGRARDVARKNDLNQLQAAIVVSYQDKGGYPCVKSGCKGGTESDASDAVKASEGLNIQDFKDFLIAAGMNNVPGDPMATNEFYGIKDKKSNAGDYMYLTVKSHGIADGGFVLMAKSEVEGSSNWVVCTETQNGTTKVIDGKIDSKNSDVKDFHACTSIKRATGDESCKNDNVDKDGKFENTAGPCIYSDEGDLRYVVVY